MGYKYIKHTSKFTLIFIFAFLTSCVSYKPPEHDTPHARFTFKIVDPKKGGHLAFGVDQYCETDQKVLGFGKRKNEFNTTVKANVPITIRYVSFVSSSVTIAGGMAFATDIKDCRKSIVFTPEIGASYISYFQRRGAECTMILKKLVNDHEIDTDYSEC